MMSCLHVFIEFYNFLMFQDSFPEGVFLGRRLTVSFAFNPSGWKQWYGFIFLSSSDDIWGSLECHVTTRNKGWNSDLIILSSNQSPADLVLVLTSC